MVNKRFWTPWVTKSGHAYSVEDMLRGFKLWEPSNCRARSIGEGTIIGAFCDIGKDVVIGKNCLIQSSCIISNEVRIGDECFLGPGVNILNDKYMAGGHQPPVIGDMVHIGGGTIINPGVCIGDDVFICSGALITKDVPNGIRIEPKGTVVVGSKSKPSELMFHKGRVVW